MSGDSKCKKCSQSIDPKVDHYAECEGYCTGWFHHDCVRLSEGDLLTFSFNIIWMCDECMIKFRRTRESLRSNSAGQTQQDRRMSGEVESSWIENEVKELKKTVAGLIDTLAKMTPIASTLDPSPPHSTPISSLLPLNGTNACNTRMDETDSTGTEQRQQSKSASSNTEECKEFSLYLTNIDKCATETDVRHMVSRSLAVPLSYCYEVVKLVPKWKNVKTLDYVSFRIVLNERWKPLALNPSTWPKGVVFREFVNRSNETWRPI